MRIDAANLETVSLVESNSETYGAQARLFKSIVSAVARACERANSRFDYRRFEKANGLAAIHHHHNLRDAIETEKGPNLFSDAA